MPYWANPDGTSSDALHWPYSFLATLLTHNFLNLTLDDLASISVESPPRAPDLSAPPALDSYDPNAPGAPDEPVIIHYGPTLVLICLVISAFFVFPLVIYACNLYTTLLSVSDDSPATDSKDKPTIFSQLLRKGGLLAPFRGFLPATTLSVVRGSFKKGAGWFLAFFLPEILAAPLGAVFAYVVFARWAMVVTHIQISTPSPNTQTRWLFRTWPFRVIATPWSLATQTLPPLILQAILSSIRPRRPAEHPFETAFLLSLGLVELLTAQLYLVRVQASLLPANVASSIVPLDPAASSGLTSITPRKATKIARWLALQKVIEAAVALFFGAFINLVVALMTGKLGTLRSALFGGIEERGVAAWLGERVGRLSLYVVAGDDVE